MVIAGAGAAGFAAGAPLRIAAQGGKVTRIIVGFPAGGTVDVGGR
jgi:hypothetical protein